MADPERAFILLGRDLEGLTERVGRDEKFARELYRALAGNRWAKDGASVAPSWNLAAELLDDLRLAAGRPPLHLFESGGEGQVDDTVATELGRLGWRVAALDNGRRDPAHMGSWPDPPPASRDRPETPPLPRRA